MTSNVVVVVVVVVAEAEIAAVADVGGTDEDDCGEELVVDVVENKDNEDE